MSQCPFCATPIPDEENLIGEGAGLLVCAACFNPILMRPHGGDVEVSTIAGVVDMRRLAPAGSIGALLLEEMKSEVSDLPVLPELSQRILRLLRDPDFTMNTLTEVIKEDPVLALAIMQQANSAAFGGLNEITDLNAACARLGMRTIANTVQLVANKNLFITGNAVLKVSMERLWKHAIATAHCANEIARLTLAPNLETIFLAGLIHDIGKVLLLELVTNPRNKVVQDLQGKPELLREVLDNLHALFGLLICQAWKMPPVFRAAVYFHHMPQKCPVKEWHASVHTVSLANILAIVEGYSMYDENPEVFLTSDPSTIHLGLSDIKLATMRVDLSDKLEALFEVAG